MKRCKGVDIGTDVVKCSHFVSNKHDTCFIVTCFNSITTHIILYYTMN